MSTGAGRSVTAWLAAAALCAVVGCADEPEQDQTVEPPAAPTCDVGEVLMRNGCLACHGAGASLSGGGVDLRAEHLEASVKGVRSNSPGCGAEVLVNTERPEASVLLYSVSRGRPQEALSPGCVPMPMPLGGGVAMPAEDVACLERWVRSLEPEREPEVETRYTAPALSTLTRVKYLLDGGAVTELELQRGSQSDGALSVEGLEALVAGWMTGERFHRKRRQFLELQLQQTPSDGNYFNQFRNTRTNNMAPVREALNQSLIRTAERLIDDGEDFRSILTTSTWEVTTTTLLALKMADNPMVLRANGVWIKNHAINDLRYVTRTEGLYDRERDTADWRTVTLIHNPSSTDMTTEEEIMSPANAARLRAIPDGGTLELRTPRLGFFTSPAFFQTWQTNRDNDFRVIINQAMIIATGLTFSPGDSTPLSGDLGAVDSDLFPRDSTCYGCHKNLDPMRSAFLAHFDPINTRHRRLEVPAPQPGFAFQGHRAEIDSLRAWADALAQHPNFATAWVLKLCQWASSIDCAPSDPQVVELAQRFAGSGYQLSELFVGFFTSPLVTQASDALDSVAPGAQVSVARRGHYCHAVEARLSDLRVAQGRGARLPDRLQICDANEVLSDSVPNDQVVRGSTALHQPRDVTSMVSVAFEGMCSVSAAQVVDDHSRAALDPGDPATALELINTHVLGFPPGTEQHQRTGAMLGRSFRALTASPPCASTDDFRAALAATEPTCGLGLSDVDALRDVWTMACQSPSLTGVGP